MSKCKHSWNEVIRFKKRLLVLRFRDSVYSQCSKCGVIRHDNDGEIVENVK